MKHYASAVLVGLLTIGVLGCSKQGPESSAAAPAAEAGTRVGLSISTLNNPFFVALRDGAQAEASHQGVQLITVDAQDDPAKQIASVEDLIQKKVKVILLNPTDSDAVANVVKQATAAGIPVISLDRSVNGAEVVSHIASDNVAGGQLAGEFLLEKLGGQGKLIEIEGVPGTSAARERGQGFHQAVDGKPGVQVVAKQPADFDRAKGMAVTENILQGNKDVQGLFAHNDEMALGARKAAEAAGLHNLMIVGFDATPDAVAAVLAGDLTATVQQKPELIGQYGVQTARKLIDGQPVEKSIPVPLGLVKK
jgi:ribose transport system substrate-binding protein